MLWATMTTGTMGLFLGLRFRVPAVLAASAGVALLSIVAAPLAELSLLTSILVTIALVSALQGGYFAEVIVSNGCPRLGLLSPPGLHTFADNGR